jgi:hypothetical protein
MMMPAFFMLQLFMPAQVYCPSHINSTHNSSRQLISFNFSKLSASPTAKMLTILPMANIWVMAFVYMASVVGGDAQPLCFKFNEVQTVSL